MTPPAFRLFVSSTFSDLKAERNALREKVFPRLDALSAQYHTRFQAIDLRWGISEEAAVNQKTITICLQELKRCQTITPRPNFIILLGNRYGWRPLPEKIAASEFEELLQTLSTSAQRDLFEWYRRDDNAVPAEYCLLPREGMFRDKKVWDETERTLRHLLLQGIENAHWDGADARRIKYEASATHQEIIQGALKVPDADQHVFCFFREINHLPQNPAARDYTDDDTDAQHRLISLKQQLRQRLPKNVYEYAVNWEQDRPSLDYLDALCDQVYACLAQVIEREASQPAAADPEAREVADHTAFYAGRARLFVGQSAILSQIKDYINGPAQHPLILHGPPGSGKSAIMAKASQRLKETHGESTDVILRSIGATPASTTVRTLLQGLCSEISRRDAASPPIIPSAYHQLAELFTQLLSAESHAKKIVVFNDALEQLQSPDPLTCMSWLPNKLAVHVKLVVSLSHEAVNQNDSTPDYLSLLLQRMPAAAFVPLESMTAADAEALLDQWLREAGRTLQPPQRREIMDKFAGCPWPLYLWLAFATAQRWHSFAGIEILAKDIAGLMNDLFARLELPEHHGNVLVSRTLAYLTASRNGLSEDELLAVLSADQEVLSDFFKRSPDSPAVNQLPVIVWSRLRADIDPYLTLFQAEEALLLSFSHQLVSRVIFTRYLSHEQDRVSAHKSLAACFHDQAYHGGKTPIKTNPRACLEMPYHEYQGRLFTNLFENLISQEYLDFICTAFSQETMLEILELGLAAAREEANVRYAVMSLVSWGYVFSSDSSDVEKRIQEEIESGHIARAIRIISNRLPVEQAGVCFVREAHLALDRNDLTSAAEFVRAFLRAKPPHTRKTLRAQLRLADRLACRDFPDYLNILIALKPEDTCVRILLFLAGTAHFSPQLVNGLARLLLQIDDPYWRGLGQFALCCRAVRHGLTQASALAADLRETIRVMPRTNARSELIRLCSRAYRWLRPAGFTIPELNLPDLEAHDAEPGGQFPAVPVLEDPCEDGAGALNFLADEDAGHFTPPQSNWIYAIQRALGTLTDSSPQTWHLENDGLCRDMTAYFKRVSTQRDTRDEEILFYYSLLPAEMRKSISSQSWQTFDLGPMTHETRLQILFSLRRLGELPSLHTSLSQWGNSLRSDSDYLEFCRTLQALHPTRDVDLILYDLAQRLSRLQDTPASSVVTALIEIFLQYERMDQALFWLGRLRSILAPSMEINWHLKLDERTALSYALLNVSLPPVPEPDRERSKPACGDEENRCDSTIPEQAQVEQLKVAAGEQAQRLLQSNRKLGALLAEEFGLQTPPAGYLADRILAFWVENLAWNRPDETENLACFAATLKLGVVNDDRERQRTWFFWLLAMSTRLDEPQFARWREGVLQAFTVPLHYERSLAELFNLRKSRQHTRETETSIGYASTDDDKLSIFKTISGLLQLELLQADPGLLGVWADAALKIFSQPAGQALAFAFLSEASVRINQPHITEAYLATVQALDEDVIDFARERVVLAQLARTMDIDALGQWPNPHTFKETFCAMLRALPANTGLQQYLQLTKHLPQVPDQWDSLLAAICASGITPDERTSTAGFLLNTLSAVETGKNQENEYAATK